MSPALLAAFAGSPGRLCLKALAQAAWRPLTLAVAPPRSPCFARRAGHAVDCRLPGRAGGVWRGGKRGGLPRGPPRRPEPADRQIRGAHCGHALRLADQHRGGKCKPCMFCMLCCTSVQPEVQGWVLASAPLPEGQPFHAPASNALPLPRFLPALYGRATSSRSPRRTRMGGCGRRGQWISSASSTSRSAAGPGLGGGRRPAGRPAGAAAVVDGERGALLPCPAWLPSPPLMQIPPRQCLLPRVPLSPQRCLLPPTPPAGHCCG